MLEDVLGLRPRFDKTAVGLGGRDASCKKIMQRCRRQHGIVGKRSKQARCVVPMIPEVPMVSNGRNNPSCVCAGRANHPQ